MSLPFFSSQSLLWNTYIIFGIIAKKKKKKSVFHSRAEALEVFHLNKSNIAHLHFNLKFTQCL